MHGKSGLAIQFYLLAKKTGNNAFESFAGDLLDEIVQTLSTQLPVDFEHGLAGIGWGMEYLIQNGYLDADGDEVLEELDNQIFKAFLENTSANVGLLNGILGTGYYFQMRVRGTLNKPKSVISGTNELALLQICNRLNQIVISSNGFAKEPRKPTFPNVQPNFADENESAPYFDITWDLTTLIGFLSEMLELDILEFDPADLLYKILRPLVAESSLPLLQCNRLLLLYTLMKLKNTVETKQGNSKTEIGLLSNQIVESIITRFDNEKYMKEIDTLSFSLRNGISGLALIQRELYEQTGETEYKNRSAYLLSRLKQNEFINGFRYDYSNPLKANEQELGILNGISGVLVTALLTEND